MLIMLSAAKVLALTPRLDEARGRWGLADDKGAWAVKPQFSAIDEAPGGFVVSKDEKRGFYNASGTEVAKVQFDEVKPTRGGYVLVRKGEKWGVVSPMGKTTIKPRYTTMTTTPRGMLCVTEKGLASIVSMQGTEILAPSVYTMIRPFNYQYLIARSPAGVGLLSQGGGDVVGCGIYTGFDSIPGRKEIKVERGTFVGLLSGAGRLLAEPRYHRIEPWSKDGRYFLTTVDSLHGLLRADGREALAAVYDDIEAPQGEPQRFKARRGGKAGIVADGGRVLLPFAFDSVGIAGDGTPDMLAFRNGEARRYGENSRELFTRYSRVGRDLRAVYNDTSSVALVDRRFNYIVPEIAGRLLSVSPLIILGNDSRRVVVSPTGKVLADGHMHSLVTDTASHISTCFMLGEGNATGSGRFLVFDAEGHQLKEASLREAVKTVREAQTAGDTMSIAGITALLPDIPGATDELTISRLPDDETSGGATIDRLWISNDVKRGNRRGLLVNMRVTLTDTTATPATATVLFFTPDSIPLPDIDLAYCTGAGQVAVETTVEPADAGTAEVELFIPYSQLHLASQRRHPLMLRAGIYGRKGQLLAASPEVTFTITTGSPQAEACGTDTQARHGAKRLPD